MNQLGNTFAEFISVYILSREKRKYNSGFEWEFPIIGNILSFASFSAQTWIE